MNLPELLALGYLIAGIGVAGACSVWYSAQVPNLDRVDSAFLTFVVLVIVVLWPVVLLAVALHVLWRRLNGAPGATG